MLLDVSFTRVANCVANREVLVVVLATPIKDSPTTMEIRREKKILCRFQTCSNRDEMVGRLRQQRRTYDSGSGDRVRDLTVGHTVVRVIVNGGAMDEEKQTRNSTIDLTPLPLQIRVKYSPPLSIQSFAKLSETGGMMISYLGCGGAHGSDDRV